MTSHSFPSCSAQSRQPRPPRLPWIAAAGLCASLLLPIPGALAQGVPEDAFRAYADRIAALGIEISYGPIDYDPITDTLTIPDLSTTLTGVADFSAEAPAPDAGGEAAAPSPTSLAYSIVATSGMTTIKGLSHTDGAFFAELWSLSDDTRVLGSLVIDGKDAGAMDLGITGTRVVNYAFSVPELPADDPDKLASRWLPVLKSALVTSYDLVEVAEIAGAFSFEADEAGTDLETVTGDLRLTGYRMSDAVDGRIGEFVVESTSQSIETRTGASGPALKQTTTQGLSKYSDINFAALVDLLDPTVPETGNPVVVLGAQQVDDYIASQELAPGVALAITVDSARLTDLTTTKRDFDFLGFADGLFAKREPDVYEAVTALIQLYRSFGIGELSISGMKAVIPDTENAGADFTVDLAEIGMSDMDSAGIGEIRIAGLNAPRLPDGAAIKLDRASLGDVQFAPYDGMAPLIKALVEQDGEPPAGMSEIEIARIFVPRSIRIALEGLDIAIPGEGRISVGAFEQAFASTEPPFPTSIHSKSDSISIPVDTLDDPDAIELFRMLGLDTVTWSDETRLYWDEATLDLVLEKLMVTVEGIGRAEASMKFANVPKALFEDPENQAQMAMVMAAFVSAEISFVDGGVTTKAIKQMAQDAGVPEGLFIQALIAQAEEGLQQINNPAFTKTVTDAVADFLANPGAFRVTLAPKAPVPIAQIVGSIVSPQVLPDLLNVQVTSTQ